MNKNDLFSCDFVESENVYQISKNQKVKKINCKIINNGSNWINHNVELLLQPNENFSCDTIKLNELKKNEQQDIRLFLKEKNKIEKKEYILLFDLIVDEKKYGNTIEIRIKII